jgi:hypothetical protein
MHFHLPKPLHGWRAFVGEVGIIVIGVLIALAAEQLVERWQWNRKVAETTTELNAELHRDALSAYDWSSVAPCIDQQLAAIDAALASARHTGRVEPTKPLTPPLDIFTEDSWLNARALQVADHLPPQKVVEYSALFFLPRDLGGSVIELHNQAAQLRSLSSGVSPISTEEVGAYQRQAGRVHELLDRVELGDMLLLSELEPQGIKPSNEEARQILRANRSWAGACVRPPDRNRRFDPGDVPE